MAFEADVPKAAVAPVSDRKAPILMLFDRSLGIEHAGTRRHSTRRSWKILVIWRVFYRIYKIVQDLHVNLASSCKSCKKLRLARAVNCQIVWQFLRSCGSLWQPFRLFNPRFYQHP